MKQSRGTSFLKSIVSTAVGFVVAYLANMLILPWFGLDISHSANLLLTTIYTVISIARGYALERFYEAMGWRTRMSAFALAVLAERQRQTTVEGWSTEHDDAHNLGELGVAGAAYVTERCVRDADGNQISGAKRRAYLKMPPQSWPWSGDWWKPQDFRRDLVKGAALILAEGERFDRNRKRKSAVSTFVGGYQPTIGEGSPTPPPHQDTAGRRA